MALPLHLAERLEMLRERQKPKILGPIAALQTLLSLCAFLIPFYGRWEKEDFAFCVIVVALATCFSGLVNWKLWKGENWARILTLFASAHFPFTLLTGALRENFMLRGYYYTDACFSLFLLYWLNTKMVREYFHRNQTH